MKTTLILAFAIVFSGAATAQKLSDKLDNTSYKLNRTANSVENAANTAGKIMDLGKNLFGGKKKKATAEENPASSGSIANNSENSYQITLKGIDYENPLFGQIFTKVKTFKGVSSSKKSLEGAEGIISFNFTGDISEIWDSLDDKTRQSFKVEKITENNIKVVYKK